MQKQLAGCNKLLEDIRGQLRSKKKKEEDAEKENRRKQNDKLSLDARENCHKNSEIIELSNQNQEIIVLASQRREDKLVTGGGRSQVAQVTNEENSDVRARNIVDQVDWNSAEDFIKERNVLVPAFSSAVEIR
jgi:hypothetical protein